MTLLAVPNISEGRDPYVIAACIEAARSAGATLLDAHTDAVHNRTVLTLAGDEGALIGGCVELARAAGAIDLRTHRGVHPRLGGLDVCPIVCHGDAHPHQAATAARTCGRRIGEEVGVPVFLYGWAATRPETRELPSLRKGGLEALAQRIAYGLAPDAGPAEVDPGLGVVCVGARGPLIAFNVWIESSPAEAKVIASRVRSGTVRALGLALEEGVTQVSMNLIDPEDTGVEAAFDVVADQAGAMGVRIRATELVGLVERRFLPNPETTAARLLLEPGRTVEEALERVT